MFNIVLQEKAIALKIGRQKKIQIIDGQQVEVLTGDDEDDEVKKYSLINMRQLQILFNQTKT